MMSTKIPRKPEVCTMSEESKEEDVPSKETYHHLENGIFMHARSARILSIFAINVEVLDQKQARLDKEYRCILPVSEEINAPMESVLKLEFKCEVPSKMKVTSSRGERLLLDSAALRKKSHQIYFDPTPHPNEIQHPGSYKVIYKATAMKNGNVADGIDTTLEYSWPLAQQESNPSGNYQQFHVENLHTAGDVYLGGQGQNIERRQQAHGSTTEPSSRSQSAERSSPVKETSQCPARVLTLLEIIARRASSETAELVGDSQSLETDGCGISIASDVFKNTQVKISVADSPCDPPPHSTRVSRMLKCIMSDIDNQVTVKLRSLLHPKPDKGLNIAIMSKSGEDDWKKILEVTLDRGNTLIKYEVSHFCWHVAVVSEEEERNNGEYHLFNDVWMHKKTRTTLSLFCKDEISLDKASKALENDYTRVLPLPEELIVGIGDAIHVEYEVPSGVKIESIDDTNGQLQITHERMKGNYFPLFFQQVQQSDKTPSMELLEAIYAVTVFEESGKPTGEAISAPLDLPNYEPHLVPPASKRPRLESTESIKEVTSLQQQYRDKGRLKSHFGAHGKSPGSWHYPCGMAVTPDEKIVVADLQNHRIQIIDRSGNFIRGFGDFGAGPGQLDSPCDVCLTASGRIVVADKFNNRLQVFDGEGRFINSIGQDKLTKPWSVAANNDGSVTVVDRTNSIRVFSLDGNLVRKFGESWFRSNEGEKYVAVSRDDKVIVSEYEHHRIGVFEKTLLLFEFGGKGKAAGQFLRPAGVVSDQDGNIIVADRSNFRVQVFDKNGGFITSYGGLGLKPVKFGGPHGVAILKNGDIIVSDIWKHRFLIF